MDKTKWSLNKLDVLNEEIEPVFSEPWEAITFAMLVTLEKNDFFSWSEWTNALGNEIKFAQSKGDDDYGDTYYHHVLSALEKILQEKSIVDEDTLRLYQEGWARVGERTQHGRPLELTDSDLYPEHHE